MSKLYNVTKSVIQLIKIQESREVKNGKKNEKLTRAGAGALAGVMIFGLAAPLAPLSVEAADEVKNLAIGSTATVNDKETDYWGADKAVDGIVNRTAAKRDQSRWATNVGGDADAKC